MLCRCFFVLYCAFCVIGAVGVGSPRIGRVSRAGGSYYYNRTRRFSKYLVYNTSVACHTRDSVRAYDVYRGRRLAGTIYRGNRFVYSTYRDCNACTPMVAALESDARGSTLLLLRGVVSLPSMRVRKPRRRAVIPYILLATFHGGKRRVSCSTTLSRVYGETGRIPNNAYNC